MTTLALEDASGVADSDFFGEVDATLYAAFAAAAGMSASGWAPVGTVVLQLDGAAGVASAGPVTLAGTLVLALEPAAGTSGSTLGFVPQLSDNPPIEMALGLSGQYLLYPPIGADDDD